MLEKLFRVRKYLPPRFFTYSMEILYLQLERDQGSGMFRPTTACFRRSDISFFVFVFKKKTFFQPIFNILVHVFDLDPVGDDDYLGMTIYTHLGSGSTVRTVTTTPSHKNLRYDTVTLWYKGALFQIANLRLITVDSILCTCQVYSYLCTHRDSTAVFTMQ